MTEEYCRAWRMYLRFVQNLLIKIMKIFVT